MSLADVINQGLVGLSLSMDLWLVAAGLTIAFGVAGVLNFAHGSFYMLGAYFGYTFYQGLELNFWLSLLGAAICTGLIGLILEITLFRRIYKLDVAYQLILTFGFILILGDLAKMVWGSMFLLAPMPEVFQGMITVMGRTFPYYSLFVIGAGITVGVLMWMALEWGWWGKIVRATAADREMAESMGINTALTFSAVFLFAAALAGLAGAMSIPWRAVDTGVGTAIIIQAFIITVIGGLGNLKGAFVGALIVGLASAYGILFFPGMQLFVIYVLMAVVLIVKPEGLLGER